ncbi:integral peroxisomal membrane peroxin-domain-containing protein [Chytridium lagenaria]|nr:integral peroxisomal membrane peroxin-domain-containing protein [Chytridium lagenaria]
MTSPSSPTTAAPPAQGSHDQAKGQPLPAPPPPSHPSSSKNPQQPLSVMLTASQTLVGRLSPIVLPLLHWATYVSTWQDRSSSFAVCALWCLLCLAPRFCLVYGPHAIVLMYMGYHYSEKIKNPKGKPSPLKVPPLPKMVRYITRILNHVHTFLDTLDSFIAKLSWKAAVEQDSIHLFQAILLSYFVWILLNAMLPMGVILMLSGLVLIAWHSELGEIVREVVSSEWEKARGRSPSTVDATTLPAASTRATTADQTSSKHLNDAQQSAASDPSATVGTVSFGNFEATVSLNPYSQAKESPEAAALKKAEKEAKVAFVNAKKAQIQADKAEEIARAAIVASELAAAVAMEDVTEAAAAQQAEEEAEQREEREREERDRAVAENTGVDEPVQPSVKVADVEPIKVKVEESDSTTHEDSAEAPASVEASVAQASVEDSLKVPKDTKRASVQLTAETSKDSTTTFPIIEKAPVADDAASIASNTTSNLSSSEVTTASLLASNRLQQKLADLAKKRLREAAAAKSAAAAAAQRAAERLAAVKAATPEPRRGRLDEEDDDDDDSDMGANTFNLRSVEDPYLSVTGNASSSAANALAEARMSRPISAAVAAASKDSFVRPPARTSSKVHSELLQQQTRALSPEYQVLPSPTPDPTSTMNGDDTNTVILHDDTESYISGYSTRTASLTRSLAGSSVSAQWNSSHRTSKPGTSTRMSANDPDAMLANNMGLSQLGYMVGQSGSYVPPSSTTPTPSGLSSSTTTQNPIPTSSSPPHKRSSIITTTTDDYDAYDSDDHDGSVLSHHIRQRRRSLESDMYTLDRHEGSTHPTNNSFPRPQRPNALNIPRPLAFPPTDPFATKAERLAASTSSGSPSPSSTHSNSYFSAIHNPNPSIPLSPGSQSAISRAAGTSIMSRSSTRWENRKPLDVVLSFECFENQRWWVGVGWVPHLLPAERPPWTDFTGTRATPKEAFELLPFRREQLISWKTEVPLDGGRRYAWEWDGNWYVDTRGGGAIGEVDEEGWAYADNFWKDWKNRKTMKRVVRHRRWVRHARLFEVGTRQNVKFSSESLDEEPYDDDNDDEYVSQI